MNRREFFRRTVPAVAVTVAATSCGWSFDSFKRLLRRVLSRVEQESRTAEITRQLMYQSREAIRDMAQRFADYFYEPINKRWVMADSAGVFA